MTDKEKLEKIKSLADKMYRAMQNLTTDTAPIRKAMNEYHQFIIQHWCEEEPVSKDLEEAATNYAKSIAQFDLQRTYSIYDFKAGANWQKKQMMENAIDGVVTSDYWDSEDREVDVILADDVIGEEYGIKDGDKVKMIIIKED